MSRFWAVTSYFNPARYRLKLLNYRLFRERLPVPLSTVELSHDGCFDLSPCDADSLLQIRGGDVMWQKERLLNLAISRLPGDCEFVAWLDCDIIFQRPDWVEATIRALERAELCQLYRTVHHLSPGADMNERSGVRFERSFDSLGFASSKGFHTPVASVMEGNGRVFKRGHAWGARRDLIAGIGLYDRNILGGGDKLVAQAVTGQAEEIIRHHKMGLGHADDYRRWASRFCSRFQRLGYTDGDLWHLWHGDLIRRRYVTRFEILTAHDYNPATDITLHPNGCWQWNSAKPGLHSMVRQYFEDRKEDGDERGTLNNFPDERDAAIVR